MPYVRVHIDAEDVLDDLDEDTIADHLRKQGFACVRTGRPVTHTGADEGVILTEEDLGRLATLLMCGQQDAALEELFAMVNPALGSYMFDTRKVCA